MLCQNMISVVPVAEANASVGQSGNVSGATVVDVAGLGRGRGGFARGHGLTGSRSLLYRLRSSDSIVSGVGDVATTATRCDEADSGHQERGAT